MTDVIQPTMFPELEPAPSPDPAAVDAEQKAKANWIGEHAPKIDYTYNPSEATLDIDRGPKPLPELEDTVQEVVSSEAPVTGPAAVRAALAAAKRTS